MTTDQAGCKQTAWLKEVVLFLLSFFFNNASTTTLTVTKDAQIHHAGSTCSQPYILGAYIFPPDASQMFSVKPNEWCHLKHYSIDCWNCKTHTNGIKKASNKIKPSMASEGYMFQKNMVAKPPCAYFRERKQEVILETGGQHDTS